MINKAHRARRDTAEPEVIHALEACGWHVRKIAQRGLPDLLIWRHDDPRPSTTRMYLVEVKTGKGKLRASQQWTEQGLDVPVLRSAEQVFVWHARERGGMAR